MTSTAAEASRFWSMVDRGAPNACWPWTAARLPRGYGKFSHADAHWELAHRAAWRLEHGSAATGTCVLHRCDNPPCCNPHHLFIGSHAENMADKVRKHRQSRRPGVPRARLNAVAVRVIRLLAARGVSQQRLADAHRITASAIQLVVTRKTWQSVAEEVPAR